MITIEGIRYRTVSIESLQIPDGVTSVIGPNGSGKTTLLKLCAGITIPEKGSIHINGTIPRYAEIGWVNEFPDRNMIFSRVFEEIASSLRFRFLPDDEIRYRTANLMENMGISYLSDRNVRELSGGEKVLIALAAAVIHRPTLLVLDEYDSHLDAVRIHGIDRILRLLALPHVLRSTQDPEAAARGDYVIFMQDGRIHYFGSPAEVFQHLADTPFYPPSWRLDYAPPA